MATTVLLGNVAPLMADGSRADIDKTITTVTMREDWDNADEVELALSTHNEPTLNLIGRGLSDDDKHMAIGLNEIYSLWTEAHSNDAPDWVESEDEDFARVIAEFFDCPVGRPESWDEDAS